PVERLRAWMDAAGIAEGPLIRPVLKGGRVQATALRPNAFVAALKARCALIGLDPRLYGGHSLRSGFLTSAARTRASLWKMAAQSRLRSLDVLKGYVQEADAFVDHAGAGFL